MKLDNFTALQHAKQANNQKCIYLIRPTTSSRFGVEATWVKVGQAKCGLFNRLKSYRTAWPMGIDVLAYAVVNQPIDSELPVIRQVEKSICDAQFLIKYRVRNTESFMDSRRVRLFILSTLRAHKHVQRVWVAA